MLRYRMFDRISPSPFVKDVGLTAVTSGLTIVSIIIVIRFLAQGLGTEGFGAYSLSRQVISTLIPFSTVASGVAIARHLPMCKDKQTRSIYLLSSVLIVSAIAIIMLSSGFILRDEFAKLIFHDESFALLFLATIFMLIGYSMYAILYSFYQGTDSMWKANLWQLVVMALGPITITLGLISSRNLELIVFLMGAIAFTALIPLIFHIFPAVSRKNEGISLKNILKKLLSYGIPRVPGGFAFAGLLAVGPFLASHFDSLKGAGFLVVGQSVFRIVEGGIEAFGIVALPKFAQLLTEEKTDFIRKRIVDIITLVFHLGLFITLHIFLWIDLIILTWLGDQYSGVTPLIKILLASLIPYLAYAMLRSVVDAVQKKAVNTLNLFLSFFVTIIISMFFIKLDMGIIGLAIATVFGLTSLGSLTARYLWTSYRLSGSNLMLKECVLINIVFIVISIGVKYLLNKILADNSLLIAAAFAEGMIFFLYFAAIWKMKAQWMMELKNRLFKTI